MSFKSAKGAIKLCGLSILFFLFFVISSITSDEMEKRSLFNAAIAFRIFSFLFYFCFGICILAIFVKLAVKNRPLIALIVFALIMPFCPCFGGHYLFMSRSILDISRPTSPERFIKNPVKVKQLSSLAEELISRRNIYWINNEWGHYEFGIGYSDGTYVFDSRRITENYKFDIPIQAIDMNYVRYLELPGMLDRQESASKIIDQNDYEFCIRVSKIIRRIGFHDVKFYPEPNIVRYEIHSSLGLDSPSYFYEYYYSQSVKLPDNFQYKKKLNDNWYFDSKPRF